jgi:hypothetical protein
VWCRALREHDECLPRRAALPRQLELAEAGVYSYRRAHGAIHGYARADRALASTPVRSGPIALLVSAARHRGAGAREAGPSTYVAGHPPQPRDRSFIVESPRGLERRPTVGSRSVRPPNRGRRRDRSPQGQRPRSGSPTPYVAGAVRGCLRQTQEVEPEVVFGRGWNEPGRRSKLTKRVFADLSHALLSRALLSALCHPPILAESPPRGYRLARGRARRPTAERVAPSRLRPCCHRRVPARPRI